MNGLTREQGLGATDAKGDAAAKRERSSIGFPYLTLVEAMAVADAIHKHVGTGSCGDDQLAPWLALSPKSSGYRLRVSTAKLFGLITSPSKGTHGLSELGRRIVDHTQNDKAKAEAFLKVPLFNAVYEKFRGHTLPPAEALEREFHELGVAKKQTAKARSTLERSAKIAGYFDEGSDRLVKPGFTEDDGYSKKPESEQPAPDKLGAGGSGEGGGGGTRHPFIEGLLETLPGQDEQFEIEKRVAWLNAAAMGFDLIYGFKGPVTIEVRLEDTKKTAEEST